MCRHRLSLAGAGQGSGGPSARSASVMGARVWQRRPNSQRWRTTNLSRTSSRVADSRTGARLPVETAELVIAHAPAVLFDDPDRRLCGESSTSAVVAGSGRASTQYRRLVRRQVGAEARPHLRLRGLTAQRRHRRASVTVSPVPSTVTSWPADTERPTHGHITCVRGSGARRKAVAAALTGHVDRESAVGRPRPPARGRR